MARIVGGLATSHIPSIGVAIAKGLQSEPYWRRSSTVFRQHAPGSSARSRISPW